MPSASSVFRPEIAARTVGPGHGPPGAARRKDGDVDTQRSRVHRLHRPRERRRPAGRDRREVAGAVLRPVLRVDVEARAQAQDVEMSDQPPSRGRAAVRDRRSDRELLAELRRDRGRIDLDRDRRDGRLGARGTHERDGEDCEEDGSPHPAEPPWRRMYLAPSAIAAAVKTTAAITGDTSQERSLLQEWASTRIRPT